jgi:hypothetical protein
MAKKLTIVAQRRREIAFELGRVAALHGHQKVAVDRQETALRKEHPVLVREFRRGFSTGARELLEFDPYLGIE